MSPQRRNEFSSLTRPEPFNYKASYDSNNNVEYEGWAIPGSATSDAVWMICKHAYDASNNLITTQWADGANFTQIFDNRTSLTYT